MGKRGGPKFEVERRREERALLKEEEEEKGASSGGGEPPGEEGEGDSSWRSWAENPRAVESMKCFVYVQSFVMFLTFGLPQLQKLWDFVQERLFG